MTDSPHKGETSFVLRYECECGKWTSEYRKTCMHCGRPNPDYEVSPSFAAGPVSKKSVIEQRERHIIRTQTAARKRRGEE